MPVRSPLYPSVEAWLKALAYPAARPVRRALARRLTALVVAQRLTPAALMRALPSASPVPARTRYAAVAEFWDHPALQAAARAVERGFGKPPVFSREGGSIPFVATLADELDLPCVLLGVGLPDERTHAPNEFFHLVNFYRGMQAVAYLWDELAALDAAAWAH